MDERERLIHEYVAEDMEKVYYFCLKKTGTADGAFDLAQDISLGIITSISNGAVPDDLSAYVWRSARNRYADFAEKRRKARERDGGDLYELELSDGEKTPEEKAILNEQLGLLRRELAFISLEYRQIVVAFYIEDRSVRDISRSLGLPENTVKSKLFRARKILKEGIDMAREFGPKSYKPEDISFVANGSQPSGLPWSAVQTMLAKNVLLEAADNPSTVEELAVALGIAAPYMQEQVDALVGSTLLKAVDGKRYVTDFPIVSAGKRAEVVDLLKRSAPKAAEYVDEIAEDIVKKIKDMGIADRLDPGGLKWYAVFQTVAVTEADSSVAEDENSRQKARANGETWEFYGFEESEPTDYNFVSLNGSGIAEENVSVGVYVMHKYDLCGGFRLDRVDLKHVVWAIKAVCEGRRYGELSDHEKTIFDSFPALVHAEPDGTLVSNVLLLSAKQHDEIKALIEDHPKFKPLCDLNRENGKKILALLRSESSEIVRKYLPGVVNIMNHIRGFVADEELAAGRLKLPDDPQNSTVTVHVVAG